MIYVEDHGKPEYISELKAISRIEFESHSLNKNRDTPKQLQIPKICNFCIYLMI